MTTPLRILKYQNKVVKKRCIECGKLFSQRLVLSGICSDECKKKRRLKFKPQTFKNCEQCKKLFGPLDRLNKRFCSWSCKVENMKTGRKLKTKTVYEARAAQSKVAHAILKGEIKRSEKCEKCKKKSRRIEASHNDYSRPLDVEWLCVSCHRKKDRDNPKKVTYTITI